ncbi:MAG: Rid family hydrolase, partial [Allosphingosinicella sp.]
GRQDPHRAAAGGMIRALLLVSAAASLVPWSAAAGAQTRSAETVLMSENPEGRAFQERYGYSDAVVAGDTIYLSGVVVGQRESETLEAAYERTYGQIGAILKRAGAGWDDVVDVTSYHTDVMAQFEAMAAVHKRHLAAPYPAWTAIDVDRLIPERGITEIKIVARRPRPAPASGE